MVDRRHAARFSPVDSLSHIVKDAEKQDPVPSDGPEGYPAKTPGSEAAREGRKECNKLTNEQREELSRLAMAMIYGDQSAGKTTGS